MTRNVKFPLHHFTNLITFRNNNDNNTGEIPVVSVKSNSSSTSNN
jgi:hypothetical protein